MQTLSREWTTKRGEFSFFNVCERKTETGDAPSDLKRLLSLIAFPSYDTVTPLSVSNEIEWQPSSCDSFVFLVTWMCTVIFLTVVWPRNLNSSHLLLVEWPTLIKKWRQTRGIMLQKKLYVNNKRKSIMNDQWTSYLRNWNFFSYSCFFSQQKIHLNIITCIKEDTLDVVHTWKL